MSRNAATRASPSKPGPGACVNSPYTVQNVDHAVAHLERVLCDESLRIFGAAYWHARICQVEATPGIMHLQLRRLQSLRQRLPDAGANALAESRKRNAATLQQEPDCQRAIPYF